MNLLNYNYIEPTNQFSHIGINTDNVDVATTEISPNIRTLASQELPVLTLKNSLR